MLNIIIGLGLSSFGLYNFLTYSGDLTPIFYLKWFGIIGLGGGISVWETIKLLKNIKLPSLPKVEEKVNNMAKELSKDISLTDEQEQDSVCLFYLSERLKGDTEALELLKKINEKVFNLHHPVKV